MALAYTGARVGEITQLRKEDVIDRDGAHAIRMTPEAGTIKTAETRVVPFHEHLIAQGFLKFVFIIPMDRFFTVLVTRSILKKVRSRDTHKLASDLRGGFEA